MNNDFIFSFLVRFFMLVVLVQLHVFKHLWAAKLNRLLTESKSDWSAQKSFEVVIAGVPILLSVQWQFASLLIFDKYSLCIGEKNTSCMGAVLVHLYWGMGFPWAGLQLRVTLPLTTGSPVMVHTGGDGGTWKTRCRHVSYCKIQHMLQMCNSRFFFPYKSHLCFQEWFCVTL